MLDKNLQKRIKEGLDMIKINDDTTWYVPNRKALKMSILEFAEFERARLNETNQDNPKYYNHYHNDKAKTKPDNKPIQLSFFDDMEY